MSLTDIKNIIDTFDPITLEEMDNVKLMNRVDTKFTFSRDQLIGILPALKEHYRVLSINGLRLPSYESLYFDDKNLNFYIDHHKRKLNRFKVRYRKYIDSDLTFLEVKHKNKGRTDKRRIVVDQIHDKMSQEHKSFVDSTGVEYDDLVPVLLNRFHRITLVSKNENERLTFDIDLRFKHDNKEEVMENLVIAELKQEKMSRNSPFYSIMKNLHIRPYRISKYCIGVIKLYGEKNVKYNRFKKKLLKLKKINPDAA